MSPIKWKNNKVFMLDQRILPFKEVEIEHSTHFEVAASIRNMVIRGAPAIGVAAAMGVALGVLNMGENVRDPGYEFEKILSELESTRPTAKNLFWATGEMKKIFKKHSGNLSVLKERMIERALEIKREDEKINMKIGENGEGLIGEGDTVLTHCNAGSLATAGYGTALGVIRGAFFKGRKLSVIACETRPYLQGARLTTWELQKDNIPVKLITDSMAGYLMSAGNIDIVITGADRIAANGDTANKIGTYSLAVLARHHNIPFYIAAPVSTIDFESGSGKDIVIEERDKNEVLTCMGKKTALPETEVYNPAFDITPQDLITAIITERKVISGNFRSGISALFE
ncbi:MAG: S-methyl-5-thioribose-1-phosphate isomerase [Acidobacteriota bacterium]